MGQDEDLVIETNVPPQRPALVHKQRPGTATTMCDRPIPAVAANLTGGGGGVTCGACLRAMDREAS